MRITRTTRIGRLLEEHPEVEETMAWYGVDLEDYRPGLTLEALCRYTRLDLDDVLSDLQASIEEDEDEDWEDDDDDEEDDSDELEDEEQDEDEVIWDEEEEELDDDDEPDDDDDDDDYLN